MFKCNLCEKEFDEDSQRIIHEATEHKRKLVYYDNSKVVYIEYGYIAEHDLLRIMFDKSHNLEKMDKYYINHEGIVFEYNKDTNKLVGINITHASKFIDLQSFEVVR
jgi:hypothetical protein